MKPQEGWTHIWSDAIRAMESGDATGALATLARMDDRERREVPPAPAWPAFRGLLERRGYFVSSPTELRASLDEIRSVGAGFDLYDLTLALARCDVRLTECLHVTRQRSFPELTSFAPRCNCSAHEGGARR